jgi:hypothetical protein
MMSCQNICQDCSHYDAIARTGGSVYIRAYPYRDPFAQRRFLKGLNVSSHSYNADRVLKAGPLDGGLTPPPLASVPIPGYRGPPPPRPARPAGPGVDTQLQYLNLTDLYLKNYDQEAQSIETGALISQSQGKLFPRDLADMRDNVRLTRNVLVNLRGNARVTPETYIRATNEFKKVAADGLARTRVLIQAYGSQLCIPMRQKYCESYSGIFSSGKCPPPCQLIEDVGRVQKLVRGKRCVYPDAIATSAPQYDTSVRGNVSICPAKSYDKI